MILCNGPSEGAGRYAEEDVKGGEDGVGSTGPRSVTVRLDRERYRE